MARPALLVIVTGPPAGGKTSAARALAHELELAILAKDAFKETLYETIGAGEELEEKIERAGLALLFAVAGMQLEAGLSVLAESNFDARSDTEPFRRLAAEHDVRVVQVHIDGETEALVATFAERARSGDRHPGHGDEPGDAADVRAKIDAGLWEPLDLPGTLVRCDMSEEPEEIVARVRDAIGG